MYQEGFVKKEAWDAGATCLCVPACPPPGRRRNNGAARRTQPRRCRGTASRRKAARLPETRSSRPPAGIAATGATISRAQALQKMPRVIRGDLGNGSALVRAHGPALLFSSTGAASPALRQVPVAQQFLGAGAHGEAEQLRQVGRAVNVERDSRQIGVVEHHAGFAGGAR